jgi:hypothetical protein
MPTYADISRGLATVLIVGLLGLLGVTRWRDWEAVSSGLVGSYQHLRMLLIRCGWVLPHSTEVAVG